MALSNDEKTLLRQAICDGYFSGATQAPNGQIIKKPVTSDTLTAVAGMSDDDVRNQLIVYKAAMLTNLAAKGTQYSTSLAQLQASVSQLNAIAIGSPE